MFEDFAELQRELIGTSAPMLALFDFITKFGPTDLTVLITGESGTGKELVARALHRVSPRSAGAFVAVNCAELTEALLQSELFGHEKGAFTGAHAQKIGWFEIASGGTLFLDEIGELSLPLQGQFLRVLQERKIHRLGGTSWIPVDIRIIAATNIDLEHAVAERRFREDLYYRVNAVSVKTPPLRERREDIPALIRHLISKFEQETGRAAAGISQQAAAILERYSWPGNVRELRNAVERAVVLASNGFIRPEHLPPGMLDMCFTPVSESAAAAEDRDLLREVQREACRIVLARVDGNARRASEIVGREVKNFHRILKRFNLSHMVNPQATGE